MIEMKENVIQESINSLREVLDTPRTETCGDVDFAQVRAYVTEKRKHNGGWKDVDAVYNPENTKHQMNNVHKLTFITNRVDETTGEMIQLDYYVTTKLLYNNHMLADLNIRQLIIEGTVKWKTLANKLNKAGLRMVPEKSKNDRMYCTIIDPSSVERDTISVQVYHKGEYLWKTIKVSHALERLDKKANQRMNMQKIS